MPDSGSAAPDAPAPTLPACNAPVPDGDSGTASTQRVTVGNHLAAVTPQILGANINHYFAEADGLWDPSANAPVADVVDKLKRAHMGLMRWPGGTAANVYRWKRSTGDTHGCQYDPAAKIGRGPNATKDYGPAQWGTFLDAVGAQGVVMVGYAATTPAEAADLVEYLNAPVGLNPNGGIDWAAQRAADGHPAPLGITRFELGNEVDRGGEGYWIGTVGQYIDGDDFAETDRVLYRNCGPANAVSSEPPADTTDANSLTTANAGQMFYLPWGNIKTNTVTLKVGADAGWTRVDDLATAGPNAKVFELDVDDGRVTFGDNVHGAIPPAGKNVLLSYRFHHASFKETRDAMKAVETTIGGSIDVCGAWAPVQAPGQPVGVPSFAQAMKSRGDAGGYDCVILHPYTSLNRDYSDLYVPWTSAKQAHDQIMLGEANAGVMLRGLADDLAANATDAYVGITEFGALCFGTGCGEDVVTNANYSMSHVVYMASQWMRFARQQLGWVGGNTVVGGTSGLRGVLGGVDDGFLYGAEAMARELVSPAFTAGSTWQGSTIDGEDDVAAKGGNSYQAVMTGASRAANGEVRVIVVNRATTAETVMIDPGALAHGDTIDVRTLAGARFDSSIGSSAADDNTVAITPSTLNVTTQAFGVTLPPASVTVFGWQACN
ncbi:MAG: hypothetical protein QM831_46130 [Kofleriaceae bacterium]